MQIDAIPGLQQSMGRLEQAVEQLREQLRRCELEQARVFVLPEVQAGQEHLPLGPIPVQTRDGEEAFELALEAFGHFYARRGASTKAVARLPGALSCLTEHPDRIEAAVEQVNHCKLAFEAAAQQIPDEDERFDLVHRLFPGLVMPQVTRQLRAFTLPVRSARFAWGKNISSQALSPAQADNRLAYARANPPRSVLGGSDQVLNDWRRIIDREREWLGSLPEETRLRLRRELKPRPLANLLLSEPLAGAGNTVQREAHSPLILLNTPGVQIRTMKDYEPGKKRGRRSDAGKHGRRVSEVLPLFLVREASAHNVSI